MDRRITNPAAFTFGLVAFSIALVFGTVTVVPDYRLAVFSIAVITAMMSAASFSIVVIRGPRRWRIAAIVAMLPLLFICFDFLRRAPYIFAGN